MKVHIDKIENYDSEKLEEYFSDLFEREQLGDKLRGKKYVLLKPNLLGGHQPEKGVTTHPVVMRSLIRVLRSKGIKDIRIGDSPGGTARIETVYKITGMKEIAATEGVELLNFGKSGVKSIMRDGFDLLIDSQVLQAPAIINLAKYKTHSLTMFTGAVKNLFGTIPGLKKSDYHRLYPDPERFAAMLVALYQQLSPQILLNVIDGIWGMEGEGPSSGKPRQFGLMFASESASAIDFVAAGMMGFNSEDIPTVRYSMEKDNLLSDDIEIEQQWDNFVFPRVKRGRGSLYSSFINKVPKFVQRLFYRLYDYHPAFNNKCRLCRICVESCPVQVITIKEGAPTPEIDYSGCIKCMCCHEFCPYGAVYIKKTLLAKILLR